MATSSGHLHTATGARHAPPARPLVLVADDDEEIRFLFRTVLEIRGYRVIEAADGEEAVHLAQSAEPDLILMDGYLPRMDGLDATRRIRRLAHVGRVPIVFVSGRAEPAFRAEARDAGCDDYVVKPCGLDELRGVLEKHLGRGARVSTA